MARLAALPEQTHTTFSCPNPRCNVHHAGGFDMGAAVPVAEPQWSGAHQGLALFLGRLVAPLGDRPVAAPLDPRRPDGMLGCTLPAAALQVRTGTMRQLCCLASAFWEASGATRMQAGW